MTVQYFARVKSASDHEALQKLVRHYPSCSYEEWHFREAKKMADWKARRHAVKMVDVTPAEFTAYCEKTKARPDLTTFLKFSDRQGVLGAWSIFRPLRSSASPPWR